MHLTVINVTTWKRRLPVTHYHWINEAPDQPALGRGGELSRSAAMAT